MLTPSLGSFVGVPSSLVVETVETLLLRGGIAVAIQRPRVDVRGEMGLGDTRDGAPVV